MEPKAELDDFRDWLESTHDSILTFMCQVSNEEELESVKTIAPEAGLIVDQVNQHENGYTLYLHEKRHVPGHDS